MSGTVPASVDYETYVKFGISLFLSVTGSHVPQASLTPVVAEDDPKLLLLLPLPPEVLAPQACGTTPSLSVS